MAFKKQLALLTTIPSDCHSWNLIYMEMILQEMGYKVINLGVCVPYNVMEVACENMRPSIMVVSTVNGHGFIEGEKIIKKIRKNKKTKEIKVVIGGKINTGSINNNGDKSRLIAMGYDGVFVGDQSIAEFKEYVEKVDFEYFNNNCLLNVAN